MSNTTIQLRKSGQTGNTPANLAHGELAINYADGKLFYKNGVGIKSIENQKTFSTINANNSLIIATTPTDILNIVPGNNVTISTNTISKTVTINSTATGGGEDTVARELAQGAFTAANTAASNTVYLQAVNDLQNTNITSVNTFAGSAFNSANAGVTLATAAYGKANAEGAINNTQNNWIASTNTFAQAAYNTANLKFNTTGGTITGNVTIQNNLVIEGNLIVIGNSTTITTNDLSITDSLIFLANGNITTDALDIGFVGNYGGLSGEEHTGLFRDPVQKEWILFEGYTDQILSNTLINIANPTFAYANLYANVVKANLISTRATVNGLDVFSTMTNAWNSANAGVTLATAAYAQANNASGNTVALQAVNDLQNTNITAVNTFAGSAFNSANAGVTLATAAYSQANTASGNTVALQSQMTTTNTNITSVNTFAGSAFNSANAGVTLATAAFEAANTATGSTVYLQTVNNLQNTNITAVNTFAQAAYDKANTGGGGSDTVAFAAYAQANNASSNTVAIQAVNDLQNTNITSVNTFAQAGFNKANGAVQTGFTTISANAVSITPANNADTLTINPGTNITISACTTTKTITINSTASGGGGSTTLISDVRSFIANSGQTVFTVPTYIVGENRIRVFVNGVRQNNVVDYAETDPTTITLNPAADAGDNVVFEVTAFDGALNPNQNTWINNTDNFAKMAAFTANAAYNTANTPPTRGITTNATYYPVFVDANNSTASVESLHTNLNLNYNPSSSLLFVSSANILSLGVGTAPSPTGGDIRASNNITAFFSDERLKINIKPIDNALEKIQEISGVYYNTNELARTYGYTDTSEHVGVIAQQIQSVLPHAVKPAPFDTDFDKNGNIFSKSGENYLTVQYEKLIPLLIQAIKEQQEQIDELKRNAK